MCHGIPSTAHKVKACSLLDSPQRVYLRYFMDEIAHIVHSPLAISEPCPSRIIFRPEFQSPAIEVIIFYSLQHGSFCTNTHFLQGSLDRPNVLPLQQICSQLLYFPMRFVPRNLRSTSHAPCGHLANGYSEG